MNRKAREWKSEWSIFNFSREAFPFTSAKGIQNLAWMKMRSVRGVPQGSPFNATSRS